MSAAGGGRFGGVIFDRHVHPLVVRLALGFHYRPCPEQSAMVVVVLREIVQHGDTRGGIERKNVAAAAAILGGAGFELGTVVIDEDRRAMLAQLEAAIAEILPGKVLLSGDG